MKPRIALAALAGLFGALMYSSERWLLPHARILRFLSYLIRPSLGGQEGSAVQADGHGERRAADAL